MTTPGESEVGRADGPGQDARRIRWMERIASAFPGGWASQSEVHVGSVRPAGARPLAPGSAWHVAEGALWAVLSPGAAPRAAFERWLGWGAAIHRDQKRARSGWAGLSHRAQSWWAPVLAAPNWPRVRWHDEFDSAALSAGGGALAEQAAGVAPGGPVVLTQSEGVRAALSSYGPSLEAALGAWLAARGDTLVTAGIAALRASGALAGAALRDLAAFELSECSEALRAERDAFEERHVHALGYAQPWPAGRGAPRGAVVVSPALETLVAAAEALDLTGRRVVWALGAPPLALAAGPVLPRCVFGAGEAIKLAVAPWDRVARERRIARRSHPSVDLSRLGLGPVGLGLGRMHRAALDRGDHRRLGPLVLLHAADSWPWRLSAAGFLGGWQGGALVRAYLESLGPRSPRDP